MPGGCGRQAELHVGSDCTGGMPVQAAVRPRVGVGGGLLDVAQRHLSVGRGGDEGGRGWPGWRTIRRAGRRGSPSADKLAVGLRKQAPAPAR